MPNLPPKLHNLSWSKESYISFLKWWWLSRLQYTSNVLFFSLFVAPWWKVIMLWRIFPLDVIWTTYLRFSEGSWLNNSKRTPVSINVKEAFLCLCWAMHSVSATRTTEGCINGLPSPPRIRHYMVYPYIQIRSWILNNHKRRRVAVVLSCTDVHSCQHTCNKDVSQLLRGFKKKSHNLGFCYLF